MFGFRVKRSRNREARARLSRCRESRGASALGRETARFDVSSARRSGERRSAITTLATNLVHDLGFESGGANFWPQSGNVAATISNYRANSGTSSERADSTNPSTGEIDGDAGLSRSVTIPASGRLSF